MSIINATGTIYLRDNLGTVEYADNINFTGTINQITSWPCNITNSNTSQFLKLIFTTNIVLTTTTDKYFVCASDKIQFGSESLNGDGTVSKIIIQNILNYPGFIKNNVPSKNDINIFNLRIESDNSTLADYGGWVGQQNFGGANVWIINCSSNGNINYYGGGILGAYSATVGIDDINVYGCSSSGNIGNPTVPLGSAGGIVGSESVQGGGKMKIRECSSTGDINYWGGGIIGNAACIFGGECEISKCYSKGDIFEGAGGICGYNCGYNGVSLSVDSCYSEGQIIGQGAGGIIGNSILTNCIVIVERCYSTGDILGTGAGGIFGSIMDVTQSASNCYTSGFYSGGISLTGGIYGNQTDNFQGSNNFSEASVTNSGVWSTVNALPILGTNSWISPSPLEAFILRRILFTSYLYNNIINQTAPYIFNNGIQLFVASGSTSIPSILPPGYTYSIVEINNQYPSALSYLGISINNLGQIVTSSNTPLGVYQLFIKSSINPYSVSEIRLNVIEPIFNIPVTIPPCCEPNVCNANPQASNYDSNVIVQKKGGKAVDRSVEDLYKGVSTGQRTAYSQPVFKSYYDYMNYLQGKYK